MRPEPLRNKLQRQLEAVPPAHRSPLSQRTTLCTLKSLWMQLERLGEHPASVAHMRTIRTKFPNRTRDKVGEMRSSEDTWDVNKLLATFDKVIDRLEIMEDADPERFSSNTEKAVTNKRGRDQEPDHESDGSWFRGGKQRSRRATTPWSSEKKTSPTVDIDTESTTTTRSMATEDD
ncbi:unnamed protein product [Heligmosomoides polygyrus]|uniref:Uncharacterized protein n=1 Tax=Heligmosomoides polygyrus TaxID=6339 RepID=A0A3P7Y8D9_HELPZ|nr:unnamed protein product [Heligmosomoides polygyrus]